MAKLNKISISFAKEYEELYFYLKDRPNRSNFICKILKEHLNDSNDLEEIIDRAVSKALERHSNINLKLKNNNSEEILDSDRDIINALF